ncbi:MULTISPECIES: ATP-binding protein [unclassified Streptomyces]|uniref:ATP-binding protein n=1 Tax=unclassified Streptomyces TaxID=2593676 RepID=UPI00037F713A|nr:MULTISPECIES: ATP-binding protein [unclassified Streptomyces]MYT28138.1 ATP-binding protein [Streptomyces sp. SID8354]
MELPHAPSAVSLARALTATALRDLRATADRCTAALLAAELVANAVAHTPGPGPVALVVRARPAGCEVEVHDTDPTPVPGLAEAVGGADGQEAPVAGRGVRLVRGLSAAAGCRRTPRGKAVWFILPALREPRLP